ncbi:MAG: hypothetical protein HY332_10575 [Chloroflexi bacterium]|nr:hypothetical protein [Chloroflexota bacterium]
MAADGPPWTVGQNCSVTLRHPSVNANVATGFYVKPDSLRVVLPKVWYRGTNVAAVVPVTPIAAGKRIVELVVVCRSGLIHADGTPSQLTAQQWHSALLAFAAQVNSTITLVDPAGTTWPVGVEEMEDRLSPLGGQFLLEWETRLVLVEV